MSTEQDVLYKHLKRLSDFNLDILERANKTKVLQSNDILAEFEQKAGSLDNILLIIEDILARGEEIYSTQEIEETVNRALSIENDIKTLMTEMQRLLKDANEFDSAKLYSALQNQPQINLPQPHPTNLRSH